MKPEFENLLDMIKSPIEANRLLALQVAQNYKIEIEKYYNCSFEKFSDVLPEMDYAWEFENFRWILRMSYHDFIVEFAIYNGLANIKLTKREQNKAYTRLKNLIINKSKPLYEDLDFLEENVRHRVFEKWNSIKHLTI